MDEVQFCGKSMHYSYWEIKCTNYDLFFKVDRYLALVRLLQEFNVKFQLL